jgi:signal transduction histidine kinase
MGSVEIGATPTTRNLEQADTGLDVLDIHSLPAFTSRRLHIRDVATQVKGMQRLAKAFVDDPDTILQELVNLAVELCGADSADISIERPDSTDDEFYEWVATAGVYSSFLNAILPRQPSACGICLQRGRPQLFRVRKRFFDILGVEAPLVTDGILLPWQTGDMRGTIFIMAHSREEAFDEDDLRMMQVLADFAAMGVRQHQQQRLLLDQARIAAAIKMADQLAHQINNPLQSITNLLFLASQGQTQGNAKVLADQLEEPIQRLATLVQKILTLQNQPA